MVRKAVVAYKERGEAALVAPLADLVAFTLVAALRRPQDGAEGPLRGARGRPGRGEPRFASGLPVVVVPVPSRRGAVRGRGHDHVRGLAEGVVRRLGVPAEVWPVLRQRREVADQAGLGSAGRVANLAGAFRVREGGVVAGRAVVVVDDVITTGATLADAARALREAGAVVPLAVTVAATRRISRNDYGDSQ